MFNAMEVRVILKSVHPVMLEIMTVAIQRMLKSAVKVCVWISIIILHFREKHMGKCTCFYIAICTDGRVSLLLGEDYDTEYFKEDQSGTV